MILSPEFASVQDARAAATRADTPLLRTLAPETHAMTTRDGVRLDADVYRPAGDGRYPVLLMRQAYGRRIAAAICYAHPRWYAARGYVVVIQDIRGRGTSEGRFVLGEHDAEDGAATIAWAAALPGTTGVVGMYGFSYQAFNQYLAASLAGPALRAIAPAMGPWDAREGWSHSQGAFRLQSSLGWATQLAAETARHAGDADAYAALARTAKAMPLYEPVPAEPAFMRTYAGLSHYTTWRDTPDDHAYWRDISPAACLPALAERRLPTLIVAGWYDSFLEGSLAGWKALAASASAPSQLVVGPWLHFPWTRRQGGVDFGQAADGGMDALHVRWFDHWLKDEANGVDAEPPLRLFDMGRRAWQALDAWPQATRSFYLDGSGLAALDMRDGRLREAPPVAPLAEADFVVHDPWRPAPAVGGAFGTPAGPVDRTATDTRPDVLTYTTEPLAAPLSIAGDVWVELFAQADRPGFDLACSLSRVQADGKAMVIADGYRQVDAAPAADEPVTVRLAATCITLTAGDSLRLSIAGAAFPAYTVNPGTGEDPKTATGASALVTTIGVRYGPDRPSRLCLNLSPRMPE